MFMAIEFDTPIQYLKGVGPKLGDVFRRRGIVTVGDLLQNYPRAYQDQRVAQNISSLKLDQYVSLKAQVKNVRVLNMGRSHRKLYEVNLMDSTGVVRCLYFRTPYRGYFERFQPFQQVRVTGKVTDYKGKVQFQHPLIEPIEEQSEEIKDDVIPIYTESEGVKPGKLKQLIDRSMESIADTKDSIEYLPEWIIKNYNLMPKYESIVKLHKPDSNLIDEYIEFKSPAHRRFIFDEFFQLELQMILKKKGIQSEQAPEMNKSHTAVITEFKKIIPFELTSDQQNTLEEVVGDLCKNYPMHRMVQGDVGSGKTMVALMAASFVAKNGYQSALMVPTEILAEQHYKNSKLWFEKLKLKVELLTGSMKASEKKQVIEKMQSGDCDLVVGTHALIQEGVGFKNLGLVVVDEQHRFGVEQRKKLKQKGLSPHFLLMTATPIPRTLAMTVYGDLEVSIIKELPKGRLPIVTRVVYESKKTKVFDFLKEQVEKGRQAYVIYPLVQESEKIDLKNATDEYEKLKNLYPELKFGLLHGKMKSSEKESIMELFRKGEIQVLVSTTVIEVGVDVPNANFIVIEHAERFGLSQLHQLRGRVGRGAHKSYCVLILGYAVSEESFDRSKIMERTSDGFKVAEADLEIRGPGEFMGARQSGLTGFKMANLVRDIEVLKQARQVAIELVEKDPDLSFSEHLELKNMVEANQQKTLG